MRLPNQYRTTLEQVRARLTNTWGIDCGTVERTTSIDACGHKMTVGHIVVKVWDDSEFATVDDGITAAQCHLFVDDIMDAYWYVNALRPTT